MGVRAIGAFSGGLDGLIAAALLRSQGIEVHLATFSSPFFSSESGRQGAEQLSLPWREIDFTERIMSIIKDPPSGFGRNINPCIDCHAEMFGMLGDISLKEGYDIVFSGEVAGQRPMSQNKNSLNRVARLSGYMEILLRPLSAKLLRITEPERNGMVDRGKLLGLSGRSRKPQMKLAEEFGLTYSNPAGGCLLTEPNYCGRLRILMEIPALFNAKNARLVRFGRIFKLSGNAVGLVGRSQQDNESLEFLVEDEVTYSLEDRPGPTGVLLGDPEMLPELISLVERYASRDNSPDTGL
jgi:tRNA-uridine 2-sulfurtransferase